MYGLTKTANEYGYAAQTREDLLRDLLDEKTMDVQRLEDSIPVGLKRDQNRAALTHTLTGTGIGGAAGAAIGALAAGKGFRGPGAAAGGLFGGTIGAAGGSISGASKSQRLLDEREPELSSQLDRASLEQVDADNRLRRHMTYMKPELDMRKAQLGMEQESHKRKMERQDTINEGLVQFKDQLF